MVTGEHRTSDDDGVFMHINSELRVWYLANDRMIRLVKIPEKRKKRPTERKEREDRKGRPSPSESALGSDGLEVNDDECYQPQKKKKKRERVERVPSAKKNKT